MQHMGEVGAAAQQIGWLPDDEESLHCVMRGNFHGWDLVPAILKLAANSDAGQRVRPPCIATLYVATLGFNRQNTAELVDLVDAGQIRRVRFVASCYFKESSPAEFGSLAGALKARGMAIVAARSHAKVLAIELGDGRHFVVESSANLRSCRNLEQFCLTQSTPLYQFHRSWIDELIAAGDQSAKKPRT